MTTKEKIKQYIDCKGISKNKFYTITGFSTSFLDSGNTIGVDKAKIIIENFPDLNIDWLILDKGEMLNTEPASATTPATQIDFKLTDRLTSIIESQQRTIEALARGITGK